MNCPAISIAGETSVSGSLQAMDCQIEQSVSVGYGRLFGAGGAFAETLTVLLTVYVALLAYGLLSGRTRLTVAMMSPRLIAMALVLTFVTVWPAYHTVFYGVFMYGPDQIVAALLGQHGSAVLHFAEDLDGLFVRFSHIAQGFDGAGGNAAPTLASKSMPVTLFWASGLLLLMSTLGLLVLTRLVLFLLLVLGPVFIVLALFDQTRGLFNGWLRTSIVFSLAPMLTVLGGKAALSLFLPLLDYIEADPENAIKTTQPIIVLFLGALIYAAFLATLMWVAAALVRDWQAALRQKPYRQGRGMAAEGIVQTVAPAAVAGSTDNRNRTLQEVVSAGQSITNVATITAAGAAESDRHFRMHGLGQSFRRPDPVARFSGKSRP